MLLSLVASIHQTQAEQRMKLTTQSVQSCLVALLVAGATCSAKAATYTIDPGAPWLGYMNVSELPANGGAYLWGQPWGIADLRANFSGPVLSLSPNTIGDPAPYWYVGGGGPGAPGNKIMDASLYQEFNGSLAGQNVTFTGNVLANTLTSAHTSVAFIKDFAADWSSVVTTSVPLSPGVFSLSYTAINDPGRHVQFGFETIGVNVWVTDVAAFGQVDIVAVPEPTAAVLLLGGFAGLLGSRRRTTAARG
jgi:hypothetical protein